jgi:hypothetical protein
MRTAKQEALERIQSLPDEASLSEIVESLRIISKIRAESAEIKAPVAEAGKKGAPSCHDLLEDMLGSVEAERDLSTN